MRRVVIMGAGGRDFHDFNVVFHYPQLATLDGCVEYLQSHTTPH